MFGLFRKLRKKKRAWLIEEVPITRIRVNLYQIRAVLPQEGIVNLTESIKNHGILQPLIGRKLSDGKVEIAVGTRRFQAAKLAGLTTVPVVITLLSDSQMIELSLLENLQREPLSPMEIAEGLDRARKEFSSRREEDLASYLGLSIQTVEEALKLLELPPMIQKALLSGLITQPHALMLARIPNKEDMQKMLEQIYTQNLSVSDTIKFINKKNSQLEKEGS